METGCHGVSGGKPGPNLKVELAWSSRSFNIGFLWGSLFASMFLGTFIAWIMLDSGVGGWTNSRPSTSSASLPATTILDAVSLDLRAPDGTVLRCVAREGYSMECQRRM